MSRAIAAQHGRFGRACLYEMNRPLATHAHREGHLVFYLSGEVPRLMVSGQTVKLDAATSVAVNSLQPHSISFDEKCQGTLMLVLYINPIWFLEMGRGSEGALRFGTSAIKVNKRISRLVRYVANLLSEGDHFDLFNSKLHQLTQASYEQSWKQQQSCAVNEGVVSWDVVRDHRVRKSIRLMKERVGDDVALDSIASEAGLSRPHFYKLFRENVGITPNVYLNTLRMEMAIDRLITTDEPVTSIGLDLGFASQASFTRFFGSNVGIPPTDYRRVAHVS